MPTVDDEGVFMPTNGTASTPPGGHTPDLEKLHNTLFGMEEEIRRMRHFIMAMGWAVSQFRERYGVDEFACDAFDTIAGEAAESVDNVFSGWDNALFYLTGESKYSQPPAASRKGAD